MERNTQNYAIHPSTTVIQMLHPTSSSYRQAHSASLTILSKEEKISSISMLTTVIRSAPFGTKYSIPCGLLIQNCYHTARYRRCSKEHSHKQVPVLYVTQMYSSPSLLNRLLTFANLLVEVPTEPVRGFTPVSKGNDNLVM